MRKLLLSLLAAALIAVIVPLLILKVFAPKENADSTDPVPAVTAENV